MPLAGGQMLGHFRLVERIGEGGMGTVWRAVDTSLGREVALKVLPADAAADATRLDRFRREARTLAALDHPGIVTVYSVEESGGVHFLTMSLVDGETLDAIIPDRGLSLDRFFDLALALTDALAAAHEKGVVHRDLKPLNVMVTADGRLKVLDFGVAKLVEADRRRSLHHDDETKTSALTREGLAVGTPGYMSPEQIEGRPVDHRSDIFALGVLLYRMATGDAPFQGASAPSLMAAILKDTPQPVTERRRDLPRGLATLIDRCLAKQPDRRFDTTKAVRDALIALRDATRTGSASPASVATETSIAVLPFVNRNPGADDDYFSDGLSEELINALSKVSGIKVTARSSAFQFRGQELDVREVGRKLDVGTVLEGSVRIAGDRLRITAQLINCSDGYQLWSERFDGEIKDVFDTQDEIARAIVTRLRGHLGHEKPLVTRGTDNLDAYHVFLKALHHRDRMTPDGRAIELFEEAIRLAPGYAPAYAALADTLILGAYWIGLESAAAFARARTAAERALALDPGTAEAYAAMGTIHTFHDHDWQAAERMFEKAIELNPSHAFTYYWYSMFLVLTKRDEQAVRAAHRSYELDPLSSVINGSYGQILYITGRNDEAVALLENAVKLNPDDYFLHHALGWAYRECGRYELAIEAGRRAVELSSGIPYIQVILALTLYRFGDRSEALEMFDGIRRRSREAPEANVWPIIFPLIHLACGETKEALEALRKSRDLRDPAFCWFNAIRRGSRSLELGSTPEIEALLAEAGIP